MNNLFELERKYSSLNKVKTKSSNLNDRMFEKAKSIIPEKKEDQAFLESLQIEEESNQSQNSVFTHGLSKNALSAKNLAYKKKYQKVLAKDLFIESMVDMYMDALVLDEDFKLVYEDSLRKFAKDHFISLMEEKHIDENHIKNNTSQNLKNIYSYCEAAAENELSGEFSKEDEKKYKILNEKDKDKKEVSSDTKEELDKAKEDESKEISDVVKDKVIDTVKSEKEKAKNEEENTKEIKDKTLTKEEKEKKKKEEEAKKVSEDSESESEEDTDTSADEELDMGDMEEDSSDKESDSKKDKKSSKSKSNDEEEDTSDSDEEMDTDTEEDNEDESDSKSKKSSKDEESDTEEELTDEEDTSSGKKSSSKSDKKENSESKDKDKEKEDKIEEAMKFYFPKSKHFKKNYTLFESIQRFIFEGTLKQNKLNENYINLDEILAESICLYTFLETVYTSKLYNYTSKDINDIKANLIYNHKF